MLNKNVLHACKKKDEIYPEAIGILDIIKSESSGQFRGPCVAPLASLEQRVAYPLEFPLGLCCLDCCPLKQLHSATTSKGFGQGKARTSISRSLLNWS